MTAPRTVLVLFGGQSSEHRISCLSGAFVIETLLAAGHFDVLKVGITRDGIWLLTDADTDQIRAESWQQLPGNRRVLATPDASVHGFYAVADDRLETVAADVVFPVLHGKFGEDGTVQGLFDLAGIPYVGCGTLASALAMDKDIAKRVFATAGITQVDYMTIRRFEYEKNPEGMRREAGQRIGYPCFVKPANAGSSIGVTKVKSADHLDRAILDALAHDAKVLVEKASAGREIEVSVLGADDEITVSVPGEILPGKEFYDYEAKYDDVGSDLLIPAPLEQKVYDKVADMARRAFCVVEGKGLCRADFFVEGNRVYLNEINTMPGFTNISMFARLFEASGISNVDLVHRLVDIAWQKG